MMFYQVLRTKYDQFGGRAGRHEFWLFMLVHFILSVIAGVLDGVIFRDMEWYETGPISSIYWLITIVPLLALGARRLHDTGRSGWYQLLIAFWFPTAAFGVAAGFLAWVGADIEAAVFGTLALVFLLAALVGTLILFVFAVMPGDEAENAYGMPGESPERPAVYWTVLTTRYVAFAGRAGRTEFWLYTLVSLLVVFAIAGTFDQLLFPDLYGEDRGDGPILTVLGLATLLPGLSLGARRLHDIGKSGWWQLLLFLIVIGWIILFVWAIQPSQEGENKHGESPITPD